MNTNPHLQYLQQHQQHQRQDAPSVQMQLRQLQKQNFSQNQNLGLQLQGQSGNPLLSVFSGGSLGSGNGAVGFGQSVHPLVQMRLLQLQQPHLQQQPQQPQQQQQTPQQTPQQMRFANPLHLVALPHHMHLQPAQVPIIKEVWNFNVEFECNALRAFVNDKTATVFISIHQEIPGIVARPVGTFKTSSDYHFQTLRANSDLLSIIQLSLCVVKVANNDFSNAVIWQFNFLYDVTKEMFNEEHLSMLALTSQINFASHMSQGIPHFTFAELMMDSGLLLDPAVNWLSYHSGYDLGFFISLLTNDLLPNDEVDFAWWCKKYFPSFYDLMYIATQVLPGGGGKVNTAALASASGTDAGSASGQPENASKPGAGTNKPSVEYLAEELHLLPISPVIRQYFISSSGAPFNGQTQPQQMTSTLHAYLLMQCFKELLRQTNFDAALFEKFKGYIWGLGVGGKAKSDETQKSK
ncbi:ribonuclease H-like protein [Metschnikowia bicuspidata]|uniref:Ribonuclease H-like protein n=1 Tax=Metschnikowia bicuspidata TaxID=27322 RepID=A0A4P9ZFC8_9ASCO|nr:ribonuclease H-like protein [Metschnikowia bicuspidata]